MPTVAEGAAYTELSWTDKAETSAWTKKGGYIGLTMEMIDRDQTQKVRQIPNMLATAGVRTLSAAVANVFTANTLTGITLSDATVLFHASRGNIDTNALSAANWDAAIQKMFKITELGSARRLGVRPRYIVVPIELEKTALQIMVSNAEPTSNVFYDNVRRTMAENVVTCPELTSATAWLATADPVISPGVGIGYRFGRAPEVFVADQPEVGSMFTNENTHHISGYSSCTPILLLADCHIWPERLSRYHRVVPSLMLFCLHTVPFQVLGNFVRFSMLRFAAAFPSVFA